MSVNAFQRKILGLEDFELKIQEGERTKQSRSWGNSTECNPVLKYHAIYMGPYFSTETQETLIWKEKFDIDYFKRKALIGLLSLLP